MSVARYFNEIRSIRVSFAGADELQVEERLPAAGIERSGRSRQFQNGRLLRPRCEAERRRAFRGDAGQDDGLRQAASEDRSGPIRLEKILAADRTAADQYQKAR